ncbi:hypothetical protein GGS20DRAFT_590625 [Poronia punctata]|nr:hypothetical protein GGS20DRAFT_590625 [Poronia punctata]
MDHGTTIATLHRLFGPETTQELLEAFNTAFWITGLGPNTTHRSLLAGIRQAGPVRNVFIRNPPADANPYARICFFEREAAERFYVSARAGNFVVDGVVPQVEWDLVHPTLSERAAGRSRILRIRGSPEIVNRRFLEAFWAPYMVWNIDWVTDVGEISPGTNCIWYRFGSWESEAEIARERLLEEFSPWVLVEYVTDPCAE